LTGTASGAPAWLGHRGMPDRCHVTVQVSSRRVDLALPTTVPILEFTPTLAQLCQVEGKGQEAAQREATPPAWTLARVGGAPFDLTSTLAEAGVLDGEVLHLVDASAWQAPRVSDLGEPAVASAGSSRRAWASSATSWLFSSLGVAALGLVLLLVGVAGALDRGAGVVALALAGGLATFVVLRPGLDGRHPARLALVTAVALLGSAAGAGLVGDRGPLGAAGAGLGAGLALLVVGRTLPALAPGGGLVAGALALAAAATAGGVAPERTAAVVAAAGSLLLQLWPTPADGHLPALAGPDLRGPGDPGWGQWASASLSGGVTLVVLAAGLVLLAHGGWPGVGLAAAVAAELCLRSRSCASLVEVLPSAVAAGALLLGLVALAGVTLAGHGQGLAGVVLAAGVGLALVALAGVGEFPRLPASLIRLGWLGVDLALVALTLGTLGVLDQVTRLASQVVR